MKYATFIRFQVNINEIRKTKFCTTDEDDMLKDKARTSISFETFLGTSLVSTCHIFGAALYPFDSVGGAVPM